MLKQKSIAASLILPFVSTMALGQSIQDPRGQQETAKAALGTPTKNTLIGVSAASGLGATWLFYSAFKQKVTSPALERAEEKVAYWRKVLEQKDPDLVAKQEAFRQADLEFSEVTGGHQALAEANTHLTRLKDPRVAEIISKNGGDPDALFQSLAKSQEELKNHLSTNVGVVQQRRAYYDSALAELRAAEHRAGEEAERYAAELSDAEALRATRITEAARSVRGVRLLKISGGLVTAGIFAGTIFVIKTNGIGPRPASVAEQNEVLQQLEMQSGNTAPEPK